jgi:RNA polymerase sigma factor (sigma-70 family)
VIIASENTSTSLSAQVGLSFVREVDQTRGDDVEDLISLVLRAQERQADAREELVRRFQDIAVGYAYSVLGDFHAAEDAAQDAFVAALGALDSLEVPQAFPSWFRRVLYKHCDRFQRQRQETPTAPEALLLTSPEPDPAQRLEQQELEQWLGTAISSLPAEERMITNLSYMGTYTHQEISDFLGIPLTTVNNRLRSSRRRLSGELLTMAKKGLQDAAPSRDEHFVNLVGLRTAIDAGDIARVRALVEERPDLLRLHHGGARPLNDAALAGHPEIVQILLEAGADPTYAHYQPRPVEQARERGYQEVVDVFERFSARLGKDDGAAELCQAIEAEDDIAIAKLLQTALLDGTDEDGRTPLQVAVQKRRQDIAQQLLDHGTPVDAKESRLFPRPVTLALDQQDPDWPMAQLLVERGAEVDIYVASSLGDLERAKSLVEELGYPTPPVDRPLRPVHFTRPYRDPIGAAARGGHVDVVRYFLEQAGDDPTEFFSAEGFSIACSFAALAGSAETVRLLLDAGADPDGTVRHRNSDDTVHVGKSGPLYSAATHGYLEICQILLDAGAHPDTYIESTGTPLKTAYQNDHAQVIELLESRGAKAPIEVLARYVGEGSLERIAARLKEESDADGKLPLQGPNSMLSHCVGTGRLDVVELILQYEPEIHPFDPLKAACNGGLPGIGNPLAIMGRLLDHGADATASSSADSSYGHGMTLLHFMAKGRLRDHPDRAAVVDLLLEHGADIEALDCDRHSSPLGWAAAEGDVEMVDLLLQRGAAVDGGNGQANTTPLYWAEMKEHAHITERLVVAGATKTTP